MSLRSPLGRVLGSGSAKEGTDHWWMQRVTAIALGVLGLWFVVTVGLLSNYSLATVQAFIGRPWNAVMLVLLGATLAYHSALGVQVVIEDYVHTSFLKVAALLANKFVHIVVAVAATLAVLNIAFGKA